MDRTQQSLVSQSRDKTSDEHSQLSMFLLHFSTGQRLTLGFLTAALIASMVIGGLGLQHTDSFEKQSNFYQNLVEADTTLPTATNVLVLMNIEMHMTLSDAQIGHSKETLLDDQKAVRGLAARYNTIFVSYEMHHLIYQHADQVDFLEQAGHAEQVTQQRVLVDSAIRTWRVYNYAQTEVLQDINIGNIAKAQELERLQGEPTHDDALSALNSLFQFSTHLTTSVQDSTKVQEQEQFFMTLAGVIFAFIGIFLAGSLITHTFVRRLNQLRSVTQSVQQGNLDARLAVIGHDEIADVSASVNAMLETMVSDAIVYEQQKQLNSFKDQFILNISHELRTPLTQVYGFLELLLDYHGQLDDKQELNFLNKAKHGCRELIYLVNTVLDATRVGSDVQSPDLKEVALRPIIDDTLEQLDPRQKQAYTFTVTIPENIEVIADKQYLRQVLHNLVSNAIKYSPTETTITLHAEISEAEQVCICVKDSGPGVPLNEQQYLFQKFVRLKRDLSSKVRGTGLGLYVCKQLVEAMHGRIWVESTGVDGEGSKFYFMLPLATAPVVASETVQLQEQTA